MAVVSGDGTSSIRDHVTSQTARAAGSPLVIGADFALAGFDEKAYRERFR